MKNTASELAVYPIQTKGVMMRSSPRNKSDGLNSLLCLPSSLTMYVAPEGIRWPGAIRRMIDPMRAAPSPLLARNRMDSGKIKNRMPAQKSEKAPPKTNTDFQPNFGISQIAMGPPSAVPSE